MGANVNTSKLKIERLDPSLYGTAHKFLENIFTKEQNIPKELIPLNNNQQKWWCIRNEHELLGVVAAWKVNAEWHIGRFAIDKKLRGLGLGTTLLKTSLDELFQREVDYVIIDARDIVVRIILKLGGKLAGERSHFFDMPITPMTIRKDDFERALNASV